MKRQIQISVPVFFVEDGDYISAYSPHLELSGYGPDLEDAWSSFQESVRIFLEDGMSKGNLIGILERLGFTHERTDHGVFKPGAIPDHFLPQRHIAIQEKVFVANA